MSCRFLASDLQNAPLMRMILISLLALSGVHAAAAQPSCVEALERVHARYFTEIDSLRASENDVRWGLGGLAVAGIGCLWATKSIRLCGAGLGLVGGGGALHKYRLAIKLKALEDGYKMYEAYDQFKHGNAAPEAERDLLHQETATEVIHLVNAKSNEEVKVGTEFIKMVESGEICDGGNTVSKSWEEVLELLKQRRD